MEDAPGKSLPASHRSKPQPRVGYRHLPARRLRTQLAPARLNSRPRLEIDGPLQNAPGQGLQTHRTESPRRGTGTPDHWQTSERAPRHQPLVQGVGDSPPISNRLTTHRKFYGSNGIIASSIYRVLEIPFISCCADEHRSKLCQKSRLRCSWMYRWIVPAKYRCTGRCTWASAA